MGKGHFEYFLFQWLKAIEIGILQNRPKFAIPAPSHI